MDLEREKRAILLRIYGRVQGVGFRAFVLANATQLGVNGWVRNRSDGSVEAFIQGNTDAVSHLIERCHQGPASSSVDGLDAVEQGLEEHMGFKVRPSV